MPHSTADLQRLDKQHLWHPFTHMSLWLESDPLVITAADGMNLIDSDGNRYLDGVSSLWCNVHGHRVPEIDEAIRAQLDKVAHTTLLGLANEPAILLAERLIHIVPKSLTKVFYSDAGATATEAAFKMAAQYWYNIGRPEKCEFVGFAEGYHGDTVGAMSIGRTAAFHKPYFPLLFKVHYAPTPFVYRPPLPFENRKSKIESPSADEVKQFCLRQLESILEKYHSRLAAIVIEPIVQGAAGMIVQPPGFLKEVKQLAEKYDVLLIADEVAVGFARTGKMFACEHEGVEPDLMCIAKGLSGGYLPLAATLASQRMFDAFLGRPAEGKTFFHGHTYTGNPLACAAALASLNLFAKNNLVEQVAYKAIQLARLLSSLAQLPHVGDIRQKGLMVGIELVKNKETRERFDPSLRIGAAVCERIRKKAVMLRPLGDVIILMPPPAMEMAQIVQIITAVKDEIANVN